jgi:hypothetical protein
MRTQKEVIGAILNIDDKKIIKFCKKNKSFAKFKTPIKQRLSAERFCIAHRLYLSHVSWEYGGVNDTAYNANMMEFINKVKNTLK